MRARGGSETESVTVVAKQKTDRDPVPETVSVSVSVSVTGIGIGIVIGIVIELGVNWTGAGRVRDRMRDVIVAAKQIGGPCALDPETVAANLVGTFLGRRPGNATVDLIGVGRDRGRCLDRAVDGRNAVDRGRARGLVRVIAKGDWNESVAGHPNVTSVAAKLIAVLAPVSMSVTDAVATKSSKCVTMLAMRIEMVVGSSRAETGSVIYEIAYRPIYRFALLVATRIETGIEIGIGIENGIGNGNQTARKWTRRKSRPKH
jgi:hypothetical protein